jgi:hypothetical protein
MQSVMGLELGFHTHSVTQCGSFCQTQLGAQCCFTGWALLLSEQVGELCTPGAGGWERLRSQQSVGVRAGSQALHASHRLVPSSPSSPHSGTGTLPSSPCSGAGMMCWIPEHQRNVTPLLNTTVPTNIPRSTHAQGPPRKHWVQWSSEESQFGEKCLSALSLGSYCSQSPGPLPRGKQSSQST